MAKQIKKNNSNKKLVIGLIFGAVIICILLILLILPTPKKPSGTKESNTISLTNSSTNMANPASVFCIDAGFKLDIRKNDTGENGICVFPDKTECEEWSLFRGECINPIAQKITLPIRDDLKTTPLDGSIVMDTTLFKTYGTYAPDILNKNPKLSESLKSLDPDFSPDLLSTSTQPSVIKLQNSRKYFVFGGCQPHNCAGTFQAVVFDTQSHEGFIIRENIDQTSLTFLGNPPFEIRNLLLYYYFHH